MIFTKEENIEILKRAKEKLETELTFDQYILSESIDDKIKEESLKQIPKIKKEIERIEMLITNII